MMKKSNSGDVIVKILILNSDTQKVKMIIIFAVPCRQSHLKITVKQYKN